MGGASQARAAGSPRSAPTRSAPPLTRAGGRGVRETQRDVTAGLRCRIHSCRPPRQYRLGAGGRGVRAARANPGGGLRGGRGLPAAGAGAARVQGVRPGQAALVARRRGPGARDPARPAPPGPRPTPPRPPAQPGKDSQTGAAAWRPRGRFPGARAAQTSPRTPLLLSVWITAAGQSHSPPPAPPPPRIPRVPLPADARDPLQPKGE